MLNGHSSQARANLWRRRQGLDPSERLVANSHELPLRSVAPLVRDALG